jgi:predicted CopG family antitoxin
MSRTISVADDVYEWMKKHKGKKSFSELIRSLENRKTNFSDVNGLNVTGDMEAVEQAVSDASDTTISKLKDRL